MKVNGQFITLEHPCKLKEFLESRQLNPLYVAVELNGEIVRKKDFEIVTLKEEDTVEIVSFVGGG